VKGVSIIICCYNSAKRIIPTLEHLQKQKFDFQIDWEIILVDNNSSDNTIEVASNFWNTNIATQLFIIKEPQIGQAYARNTGVKNAKYSILSYIDDDNWVPNNYVSTVMTTFEKNDKIGVLGCNIIGEFEVEPPNWIIDYLDGYAIGQLYNQANVTELGAVYGAGMSIRKSALELLFNKGWQPYLSGRSKKKLYSGDDTELCYALRLFNYQIYYDKDLTIKHYIPKERLQLDYLLNLFRGFGASDVVLKAYNLVYLKKIKNESNLKIRLQENWLFQAIVTIKRIVFNQFSLPFLKSKSPEKERLDSFLVELLHKKNRLKAIINQLEKL
jgi:glycosyltransferase involved in cell wall biosynthesis